MGRSSLAHQPTSTQNRDPGAWTWSPRHQWPPSPPTPSWTLWQVGRCTCLKTRTSPSPRRSSRAQCPPPASLRTISNESRAVKKKYQRKKPPTPPVGPYPLEKKERKKAQNRTAAFRYREKKKGEQNTVEEELELLATRNKELRAKLTEMETEARLLKKLMTEAGLGRIAGTMKM